MKKCGKYLLLTLLLLISSFSFSASARENQSICINYTTDEYALCDASFSLYRIGTLSGTRVIPNNTFVPYSVSYDVSDSEKMSALALTLSGYILRDNITPDYTDKTDVNGKADFEGAYPDKGVYIIMGEKHRQNDTTYFPEPVLIVLPYGESDALNIKIKYDHVPDNTTSITVSHRVLKAWVDDSGNIRPIKIEVELLRDGKVYDTAILDSTNNWTYQWDNLSVFYHWTVVEKSVAEDYEVILSQNGKTFLLTNSGSYNEETTVPEGTTTPDGTTKPSDKETTHKDSSDTTTKPSQDTTTPQEELPETGTLQWPIPYLACLGIILFIVGYVRYRKSEIADE